MLYQENFYLYENQQDKTMRLYPINKRSKGIMATITKKHLVQLISRKLGIHPNEVGRILQSILDELTSSLSKGDRIEIRDFGVFETVLRKQKIGRNPKKASIPIIIPARKAVKFTAGKKMKELVEKIEPGSLA